MERCLIQAVSSKSFSNLQDSQSSVIQRVVNDNKVEFDQVKNNLCSIFDKKDNNDNNNTCTNANSNILEVPRIKITSIERFEEIDNDNEDNNTNTNNDKKTNNNTNIIGKNLKVEKYGVVTLKITLNQETKPTQTQTTNNFVVKQRGLISKKIYNTTSGNNITTKVHAPFVSPQNLSFEIYSIENNVVQKVFYTISDFVGKKDVLVRVANRFGESKVNFRVYVACAQYFNVDQHCDLLIEYV
ncbi:hypothetical protein EDEG_01513 [Edhazardia aedis USNM 41457]|uniref:Uncharacterized protein n=1 Tax=Edhazardia aedis (strain USNM 41457) TaxID=1003232 RepID=J9DNS9_EDHAE|nr:hypothetical protein EDEG_01513 [Edhazardia aedis USNM 41457]|eukprot:EJW04195.1 hypothetical protein EDEG_01513 [Edhazardia aedis USNM 41457]